MNLDAIINGAVGAGILSIILKLIDVYGNRNKTRADVAKTIVEGGKEAVETMRGILADQDRINDERAAEIRQLKEQIRERDHNSRERDAQLADLLQKHEDLEAELIKTRNLQRETDEKYQRDLVETQRLRNEYAIAKKQIVHLEDMVIHAGEYIDKIKVAVQSIPGIDLPLNGELMESVMRLKAERAERGK